MRTRFKYLAAGAAGVALAAGAGVAVAQDAPRETTPELSQRQGQQGQGQQDQGRDAGGTPADFERAAEAALPVAEGGSVESIDREDGGYEVEVRQAQGGELEVFVDGSFHVVATERDDYD